MPVTAKLSQMFYERLGEEIANELVDWFNQVDATYRADLRELNELNFARFDAKLEQRVAQAEARIDRRFTQLEAKVQRQIADLEAKVERSLVEVRAEVRGGIAELRGEIPGLRGEMRSGLAELRSELVKWMFLFWAGTALTVIGLMQL